MKYYDWIVIGGGITGSALSYELAKQGLKVLLLEKDINPPNATRYSYGGLAYWSGTDELSRQLCEEGREIHRHLSQELGEQTEFRELDLLLTINPEDDPNLVAQNYDQFAIPPQLLSPQEAAELEPLLNPQAISGGLKLPHGHIHPEKTNQAYQQGFKRLGGEVKIEAVVQLLKQDNRITGVITSTQEYHSQNTVICAGGFSRFLLKQVGIGVPLYFTHAQVILTPPVEIQLRTLVMPAILKRLRVEKEVEDFAWDNPNSKIEVNVIEPGAIQFLDGSMCLGQISQIQTDVMANSDASLHEETIRQSVGKLLPALQDLPGTLHHCLVAFTPQTMALVGKIETLTGLHLFSGFTSTLIFAPPLARRFARWATKDGEQMPGIQTIQN